MRMRISVSDMALSQWEWNQRIKLRLSCATLHFTDRWAASQPLPQGENLTYLAWVCGSIGSDPSPAEPAILFSICPTVSVIGSECAHEMGDSEGLVFLSSTAIIVWLDVWMPGFRPGHLTWALTLITHCSSEKGVCLGWGGGAATESKPQDRTMSGAQVGLCDQHTVSAFHFKHLPAQRIKRHFW